jgi:hypothetical protein
MSLHFAELGSPDAGKSWARRPTDQEVNCKLGFLISEFLQEGGGLCLVYVSWDAMEIQLVVVEVESKRHGGIRVDFHSAETLASRSNKAKSHSTATSKEV